MKQLTALLLLSIVLLSCNDYGTKINYGKSELYYTKNVTKDQAQKLGEFLKEQKFFKDDGNRLSVQLDKSMDTFLFRMVTKDEFVNAPNYVEMAKTFSAQMSAGVFDNKPVNIHFCDDHLKTERVIRP